MERPQAARTRSGRRIVALGSLAGVLLLLAAAVAAPAQAAPGDLDLTFSGDGKQRTDFGFGLSSATATVRQSDGKIVVVGDTYEDFALARYNPNGTLDTSFAGDGRQTTDFSPGTSFAPAEANGVALQVDGKIVVVGRTADYDFALARYNPNGSLDTSFSGDGKQTTDGSFANAHGVAIQGDNKIVVVGRTAGNDFALARYNPNGSLDTSFSGDGRQTTDFGSANLANAVALQGDGKIVAVGGGSGSFALARYNPDGTLDPSFSGDGRQTTVGFGLANGVALQADGRIVVVGTAGNDFALARYNPDGTLDPSFSGDGKQTTNFGYSELANGVAVQGDGKIVAVGFTGAGSGGDSALARYNPDGTLDPSFSGDGRQTTNFAGRDESTGVALQVDGKIVAVGGSSGIGFRDFTLARYNPDGSLDTSFSGDGKQTTDFGGFDEGAGVAVQADGKIVAVGRAGSVYADRFAIARYNPNGTLDTSFSGDGRQTTDFGANDGAYGVAVQGDGKIVAVGRAGGGGFAVARYNPNGTLDASFSGDGKQTIDFGAFGQAHGVALQADGKIVVVGVTGVAGNRNAAFAVARYNPNGSLDNSWTTDFGGYGRANGVAVQGDGKIVVVGGTGGGFTIARYNPNGSLDPSFSGDGKQTTDGSFANAHGVAIQADGKIVAVGSTGYSADFALARYNPNGTLDASFSGDGRQTTDFTVVTNDSLGARGIALQADGKIVAVGDANYPDSDFALARYNPNGSLDTSFSGDGKQRTDFGASDRASGVALQGDGKVVAVGLGGGTDGTRDFTLARYFGG